MTHSGAARENEPGQLPPAVIFVSSAFSFSVLSRTKTGQDPSARVRYKIIRYTSGNITDRNPLLSNTFLLLNSRFG